MKLLLSVIAVLGIAAVVRSEESCECRTFFESDRGAQVYDVPGLKIPSCQNKDACKKMCHDKFGALTKDGDLKAITSKGITVAQLACKSYNKDIKNGQLSAFAKSCGSDWEVAGQAKGLVCCSHGQEVPCN